jgi:DNA-binding LacI/PurR family transcriptional regulator
LSQRIQQAIDELNYTPDPLARALKTRNANAIGLIIPVMSGFYMPMMNAIEREAHERDYELLITSSDESPATERELLDLFVAKRVSGIIIVPCSADNREAIGAVSAFGIPVVQVNRELEGLDTDAVISNNFKAAYQAAEHLVERGRRRIVFLGYDESNNSALQKKLGYEAAIRDHGLGEDLIIIVRDHDRPFISRQLTAFIESGERFDALIATSQGKTVIALKTLIERGYRVPEDVALIGFDDAPWAELLAPPLTMISEDTFEMGSRAVRLLIRRIEEEHTSERVRIVLEDTMTVRSST